MEYNTFIFDNEYKNSYIKDNYKNNFVFDGDYYNYRDPNINSKELPEYINYKTHINNNDKIRRTIEIFNNMGHLDYTCNNGKVGTVLSKLIGDMTYTYTKKCESYTLILYARKTKENIIYLHDYDNVYTKLIFKLSYVNDI